MTAAAVREGPRVTEITGMLDWAAGMRVIVRKERPHSGAQPALHQHRRSPLHLPGHRQQRRPARGPGTVAPTADPVRGTAARRTPGCGTLHGFAQNQIWCEITALACELLA